MPRVVWSRFLVLLIALPLASCFERGASCPTCPPEKSGRIAVILVQGAGPDSLHVTLDGGARRTVRRNSRVTFTDLGAGLHSVTVVRWYFKEFVLSSKTGSVEIHLQPGEFRVINYHNDFPMITDASVRRRAPAPLAVRPGPTGLG